MNARSPFHLIPVFIAAFTFLVPVHLARAQVSGTVVDLDSGLPIEGALVSWQASGTNTETDVTGAFSLPGVSGTDLVITAAKKGYFTAADTVTTPISGVQIKIDSVSQDHDVSYQFMNPGTCGICHPTQLDQWTGSPMAKAGSNSWVYDIYDGTGTPGGMGGFVYQRDSRFAGTNPESECASCHQPEPWALDPFDGLDPIDTLSTGAMHGISCDICHKIADVDTSKVNFPGLFPGAVTVTLPNGPAFPQVQYGLLGDAIFSNTFFMRPSYQPQLRAEVCAACHQDKNDPDEDHDFEEANGIISEPTYLEWLASPYADEQSPFYATCVDCHMPAYGDTLVCNILAPPLVRDQSTIRTHTIEGTTPFYLDNAVSLVLDANVVGNTVEAEVRITNDQTGHHVPTGVTIRNMILVIDAWDAVTGDTLVSMGAQTIHDLGGIGNPAQGYYAGLPGKFYSKVNYDSTTASGPTFFTDATHITFDNRIPALETDTTNYSFQLPAVPCEVHVKARLIYRRSFRFLTDAKGWTEDGHGNPLEDVQAPHYGHLMEEAEWVNSSVGVAGGEAVPSKFTVLQSFPNPANPATTVRFSIPRKGSVDLGVYDVSGRLVRTLMDEQVAAGFHAAEWDGRDDAGNRSMSGVYFLRLQTDGVLKATRRLVLLR